MAMVQYVTESLAYMVSANMDAGSTEFQIEAAISKVYASEAAWFCCDEAIQILGGMGYMRDCGLERVMRDLRIFRIFEGTNDILRLFVALTGIQYAGGALQQLQKAMKNPAANMGVLFGEGSKRAKRMFGVSSGESLTQYCDPALSESATKATKSIELFGASGEGLLMKHGKKIVDEQFKLNRLANAAIDVYCMVTVLSRASRSLKKGFQSAEYEATMASLFADEASERIALNLAELGSQKHWKNYEKMAYISKQLVNNGGLVQEHPLGF
jgi:very long chain acyl-CoA dehydrogenase